MVKGPGVLVLGRGGSGAAAEKLARSLGFEVFSVEGDVKIPPGKFDFAVASPGIPLSHGWFSECAERGIPVMSELAFGCRELMRRGWRLFAVTGSKGKSSVVKVVAEAIALTGENAVACGNYGLPVSEVALSDGVGAAVVEVSSFMMETTDLGEGFFEAAAVINLQEDHLDRHGTVEAYHALKLKLLTMAKKAFAPPFAPPGAEIVPEGSYFDNDVLLRNASAAIGLMRAAGVGDGLIARAFRGFEPLAHRMQTVCTLEGVVYVDDSKATSIEAMIAAVEMTRGAVRLVAGGLPKGDDPSKALPVLTKRVKKVYIIGRSAEVFSAAWSRSLECETCVTMEAAVEAVKRDALAGETVLLSPGAASYDQFENFARRGEVFASLVKKEG